MILGLLCRGVCVCVCFVSPDSVGRHMSATAMKGAQKPFIESLPEFLALFMQNFVEKRRASVLCVPNKSLFCMICCLVTGVLSVCAARGPLLFGFHYYFTSDVNFVSILLPEFESHRQTRCFIYVKQQGFYRMLFKLLCVNGSPVVSNLPFIVSDCLVM